MRGIYQQTSNAGASLLKEIDSHIEHKPSKDKSS